MRRVASWSRPRRPARGKHLADGVRPPAPDSRVPPESASCVDRLAITLFDVKHCVQARRPAGAGGPPPACLPVFGKDALQQPDQRGAFVGVKVARKAPLVLRHQDFQLGQQRVAGAGEPQSVGTAVVGDRVALDQATALEIVDDGDDG